MEHLTPALPMNRSAEHRLGAFEKRRQRAETVLGAPIAWCESFGLHGAGSLLRLSNDSSATSGGFSIF